MREQGALDEQGVLDITIGAVHELWYSAGDPVRAASGIAPFEDGWLVAEDDTTAAAWWRPGAPAARIRLFEAVEGHDTFESAAGTKHLKPDLETACAVPTEQGSGVLLLGSGSLPARTRAALVLPARDWPTVATTDLRPLFDRVQSLLGLPEGALNLEGACVIGDRLRWFQRGHGRSGVPSASVDVELAAVVDAIRSGGDGAGITPAAPRRYDLGALDGQPLAITDAAALPGGLVLAAAAAEDAVDAVADGPVAGSALLLLRDAEVLASGVVPTPTRGQPWKVEGLALRGPPTGGTGAGARPAGAVRVLAVTDADDPGTPSLAVELIARWGQAG